MTASAALAAFGGAALPAATAVPLDAARAIETAVRTHPSVAARRAALEASRAQTGAAWRQFFPALSVSADRHEGENVTVARLTQPLWTGGRLTAGLDSARLREARAGGTGVRPARAGAARGRVVPEFPGPVRAPRRARSRHRAAR